MGGGSRGSWSCRPRPSCARSTHTWTPPRCRISPRRWACAATCRSSCSCPASTARCARSPLSSRVEPSLPPPHKQSGAVSMHTASWWDVPVATSRGVCTVHPSRPSYVPTRAHRRPMPCAAHVPPRRPPPSAHRRLLQSSAVRRLSGSAELSPRGSCRRACTFRRSWRGSSRTTTCAACASPPRTGRATTRWPR